MRPLAPEVVAPISACSNSVEVKGNIAGATVEILVNGNVASSHVSTNPDSFYAVGVTLLANQKVTARQTISGQISPESLPVTVQAAPTHLSALTIPTHPHTCGRAVRVTGAVPGAKIDVLIGAQSVGAAIAAGGTVNIKYDPVLASGQKLTVTQIACNNVTATQSSPAAVAPPSSLPAPVIGGPLIECQTRITIGGVVDGATVELYRNNSSTPEDSFTFAVGKEWFWIKALVKNDVIKVRQGLSCKKAPPPLETHSPYASATVQPVSALHAPKFLSTPCPGTTYVSLAHLVPGARVILTQDGDELGQTDAPDVNFTFTVPPLKAGARLEAHMEMCKGKGPVASVVVSTQTVTPGALNVSPLYACASHVAIVFNGPPANYLVFLTNKNGQQISPYYNVIGLFGFIPVSPALIAEDVITFHIQGCGGAWTTGPKSTVLSGPPPPTIQVQLWAGYNTCPVAAMAGFILDVYVNNVWRGSAVSLGIFQRTLVPLSVMLQVGDKVTCTQTVCGVVSKPTGPATVTKQPPQAPILLDPGDNTTDVVLQPVFKWNDPGAGTPSSADSFQLLVTTGNQTVINTPVASTSFTSPAPLLHGAGYAWSVTSVNSGGNATSTAFHFKTIPPPPPPTAVLKLVPPITTNVPGNAFPRGVVFAVTIPVHNSGNAASGSYSVVFEERTSDNTQAIAQPVTVQMQPLPAGGTASASTEAGIDASFSDAVRINASILVNGQVVDQAFRVG
jgi:hypothetical protein